MKLAILLAHPESENEKENSTHKVLSNLDFLFLLFSVVCLLLSSFSCAFFRTSENRL